jgi:hypothetical protein
VCVLTDGESLESFGFACSQHVKSHRMSRYSKLFFFELFILVQFGARLATAMLELGHEALAPRHAKAARPGPCHRVGQVRAELGLALPVGGGGDQVDGVACRAADLLVYYNLQCLAYSSY